MTGTIVRFRARALAALGLAGLACALAGCAPGAEPGAPAAGVELATWNLAWLHGEDGKGTIPRREADYARLRAYAARLDADVVALQEVAGEAAAARVLDPARYAFALAAQRHAQRTGLAYRKTLAVTRHPDLVALDAGGLRHGVDLTVHLDGHDLRLLAVHLKSGCFEGALARGGKACAKLRRQVPALEAWIDAREREGVAFAVLGDFNRRLRQDDEVWRELDDRDPAPDGLTLVTDGRRSRCWNGAYPDFIDHIVLDAQAAAWLVPGSFEQVLYDSADAQHADKLSDHCPISVRLALSGTARPGPGGGAGERPGHASGPALHEPPKATPAGASDQAGDARGEPPRAGKRSPNTTGKPPATDQAGERSPAHDQAGDGHGEPPRAGKRSPAHDQAGSGPVKGNVTRDGRKLYHLPACPSYASVRIDPERGERLFASEREARDAGFRKAGNCP